MNFKETIEATRLRVGTILRERKEKAEEKRAVKARNIPHGASPLLWCIFITLVGVFALGGSTWMLGVFIAGSVGHIDWFSDYVSTQTGVQRWEYSFSASVHWFNAIGLWLLCAAIGIFNAVWIELRKHFFGTFQKWITGLGIATAVFMVAGGVVVQQRGTDARTRDEVAAVGTAQAGVAALDAELAALERRWETLCAPNLTTWQAQACRSGAAAWQDRIEIARGQYRENDPQFMIIARAIADAREGDRMQARLTELREQRARASVQTVRTETATVRAEGWMAPITSFIEDLRKPVTSILGELLAMSAFPMALAAWATRRGYSVPEVRSGWASDAEKIEDHSSEPGRPAQPMQPTREVVTDAETGEELIKITPKPHWRKTKGKKQRVELKPEPEPDETGVPEPGTGDERFAMEAPVSPESVAREPEQENTEQPETENATGEVVPTADAEIADIQTEVSEEDAAEALRVELALAEEQSELQTSEQQPEQEASQANESEVQYDADEEQNERQPITDPARLIDAA